MSTWWFLVGSLNFWTWGQRTRVRVGCPSRWVGLQCESPNDFQIMQLKHWSCFFPFLSRNYIALWIPLMPFVFCIWAIWIDMTWCDEPKRFIVPPPWETNSIQSLWSRPCKGGRFLAHGRSEGGRGQRRSLWEEQVVVGWCGYRNGFAWKKQYPQIHWWIAWFASWNDEPIVHIPVFRHTCMDDHRCLSEGKYNRLRHSHVCEVQKIHAKYD